MLTNRTLARLCSDHTTAGILIYADALEECGQSFTAACERLTADWITKVCRLIDRGNLILTGEALSLWDSFDRRFYVSLTNSIKLRLTFSKKQIAYKLY